MVYCPRACLKAPKTCEMINAIRTAIVKKKHCMHEFPKRQSISRCVFEIPNQVYMKLVLNINIYLLYIKHTQQQWRAQSKKVVKSVTICVYIHMYIYNTYLFCTHTISSNLECVSQFVWVYMFFSLWVGSELFGR